MFFLLLLRCVFFAVIEVCFVVVQVCFLVVEVFFFCGFVVFKEACLLLKYVVFVGGK